MDNVPIQFKKVIEPPEGVISDEELFNRIYVRMCELTETEPVWIHHPALDVARAATEE